MSSLSRLPFGFHTMNDTLAAVDRDGLTRNVAAYATVAYYAAEIEEPFRALVN